MAKKNSLESLIADLDYLEKNFDNILKQKYDNIMATIMLAIGKATAYDTGVSRDIIRDILKELGRDDLSPQLDHIIWEFWNTIEERKKDNVGYTLSKVNGKYKIVIMDDGFAQQSDGKVSDIHPRHDSRVIPRQVDYGIDLMETGTDADIERAFDDLEKFIVKAIEGRL